MFMFQSQKALHILQITTAGVTGVYAETMLQVPTADEVVHFIQLGAQILIAVVTCVATIRKAIQKPVVTQVQAAPNVQVNE